MIDRDELLAGVDVDTLLNELKLTYTRTATTAVLHCPLGTHTDSNPSFLFFYDSKYWQCQACNERGDAIALVARLTGTPRYAAATWLARRFNVRVRLSISPVEIQNWHNNLLQNSQYLGVLHRKSIPDAEIQKRRLGFDGERITIPIYDREGAISNVRRYNPYAAKSADKYVNIKGAVETRALTPLESLHTETILIAEGELKAYCLCARGYSAIASTAGAASWSEEWDSLFRDKVVYFVYDVDLAGQRCAASHAKRLYPHCKQVFIVDLPIPRTELPKGDVCDYFGVLNHTKEDFDKVLADARPWHPQQIRDNARDDTLYDIKLSESTQAKYYTKRIACEATVSAKDTAPYIVPNVVTVTCDRDTKNCAVCPLFQTKPTGPKGEVEIKIDPESHRLLQFLDTPTAKLEAVMRVAAGIPNMCTSCTCRAGSTCNVEEIRLIPQIDIASNEAQNAMVTAFYVGHGIETNASYKLKMRIYPSPKTQHAVGLVYEAEPNQDNLSTFVLNDELRQALSIFVPAAWTQESCEAKLQDIYEDFAANVTRIYRRVDLHMFIDLLYHSVLRFNFDNVEIKGWAEGLILGDSGQGKSETTSKLREHYGLGERVSDKSATVAGLLGGLQESGRRWILQWGAIPLNDKRLVIIEEAKGMPEEVIQKLTDARSSGVAEIVKIEKRKTNARTRLIWISNPRSQRKIATYNHGVEAIKELMGSLEDVRRFDMAMVVATGEVPIDVINQASASRVQREHKYTHHSCQTGVLFAWSRKPEQVIFEQGAVDAILQGASIFGQDYSSAIPLVESADQRLKLARLSVALAARLFSVDAEDRILVRKCIVDTVCAFLRRIYDNPNMGYREFSAKIFREESLIDPAELKSTILKSNFPLDLIRGLLATNAFDVYSLMNLGNLDQDAARSIMSVFVRKNAVLQCRRCYVKTPAFTAFLHQLQNDVDAKKQQELIASYIKPATEF